MALVRDLLERLKSSDGRIRIKTLSGVSVLVAVIALLVGVLPAIANHPASSVKPVVVNLGGGPGQCTATTDDGRLPSVAGNGFHINNPTPGDHMLEDGNGNKIAVFVEGPTDNRRFRFTVTEGDIAVYDVVVNGGQKSNHYDYDDNLGADGAPPPGPVKGDEELHAPTKGNKLHNLSHVNICYDELPLGSVSGLKYHDRDTDGTRDDATTELGLQGWTITAFDSDGNGNPATTDENGSYTIADLAPGTYTICEQTHSVGLPSNISGVTWAWTQSPLTGATWGANCAPFTTDTVTYLPVGHTVTINGNDVANVDFGNHRQVTVDCSATEGAIELILGGDHDPLLGEEDPVGPVATVTFPDTCQSGVGGKDKYTTSFDLGLSADGEDWDQFVIFSGDVNGDSIVLEQTIEWAPTPAEYVNGQLVVPTTRVVFDLTPPRELEDVKFCNDPEVGGGPTTNVPQCLDSRTIEETPADPEALHLTDIQVTERYRLLGDPGNFR